MKTNPMRQLLRPSWLGDKYQIKCSYQNPPLNLWMRQRKLISSHRNLLFLDALLFLVCYYVALARSCQQPEKQRARTLPNGQAIPACESLEFVVSDPDHIDSGASGRWPWCLALTTGRGQRPLALPPTHTFTKVKDRNILQVFWVFGTTKSSRKHVFC